MRMSFALLATALAVSPSPAFAADSTTSAGTARGIVRAVIRTTISTELVAQVRDLPFKAGESFAKGAVLVSFDCARYAAELRAAAAELESAGLKVSANQKLLRHRAIGGLEVDISKAKRTQMQARLEALQVRERQCTIRAPFAGHVVQRHIQPFEMSQPNGPLIEIVNDRLEVDLIVPSKWLVWLQPKTPFSFHIDETQQTVRGAVKRVSAVVDPISRTVRLMGHIETTDASVRPGMSGAAIFSRPVVQASASNAGE